MFCWWWRGWNRGAEVTETTVKRLLCWGFWHIGKAMGQVYQCWWRICREINVIFQVLMSHILPFISICDLFTESPSYNAAKVTDLCIKRANREKKHCSKQVYIWHVTNEKHSKKQYNNRKDSSPKISCCVNI
jgi:hypothetical protein